MQAFAPFVPLIVGLLREVLLAALLAWGVYQKILPSELLAGYVMAVIGSRATARGVTTATGATLPPPGGGGASSGDPTMAYRVPAPPPAPRPPMTSAPRIALSLGALAIGLFVVLRATVGMLPALVGLVVAAAAACVALEHATSAPTRSSTRGATSLEAMLLVPPLAAVGIAVLVGACNLVGGPPLSPSEQACAKCVADDSIAGDSLPGVIAACARTCGSAAAVVFEESSSTDPAVIASPAHAEVAGLGQDIGRRLEAMKRAGDGGAGDAGR